MIVYKIDILVELRKRGYTQVELHNKYGFGNATIQNMRDKKPINFVNLNRLCELLECQPGDIIEYREDE